MSTCEEDDIEDLISLTHIDRPAGSPVSLAPSNVSVVCICDSFAYRNFHPDTNSCSLSGHWARRLILFFLGSPGYATGLIA